MRFRWKDYRAVEISVTISPVRESEGRIVGALWILPAGFCGQRQIRNFLPPRRVVERRRTFADQDGRANVMLSSMTAFGPIGT